VIAFLGKRALSSMLEVPQIHFGMQSITVAETTTWVLPNPSGLNRRYTLAALVSSYTELRVAMDEMRCQRS
jgi:TDG/mug DNA glycosylase family protein